MAVDAQGGSINILLNYKDNLETILEAGKKKVQAFSTEVILGIDKIKEAEVALKKLIASKDWDGRLKANREINAEYKAQLEVLKEQKKVAVANTNEVGQQLIKYGALTQKLSDISSQYNRLSKGKLLDEESITNAVKLVSQLAVGLKTTGSEIEQLSRKSSSMIKTYTSDSNPITRTPSSGASVQKPIDFTPGYTKFVNEVQDYNKKLDKLHAENLAAENKYAADLKTIKEQEFNEYMKILRKEESAKKDAQKWFNRTYVDDAATTDYKVAVEKLKVALKEGSISVDQYNKGLAEEQKRLDAVKNSADSAAKAQQKLNAESREQQLKSFIREYESTPAQNQYNDALEKLNRQKKENIISEERYTAAVQKENDALKAANTTAQLSYRQRAEGFRVIDGEIKQLKGLALQYHDLKEAMSQADGGSTFGKKVGTTIQYMAAGAMIYKTTSAMAELGAEFIRFDKFARTAGAALDTTTEKGVALGLELVGLSTRLGGTNAEIQDIAMELGRAGVAMENVTSATEVVMRMARLTGDTFQTSTKAIVAYQTVFGNTYSIEQLGDKLATVANASRLTTHDIGTFSNYALASSQTVGLSIDALGALAAAFSNAGVNASTSGTSVRRFGTMLVSTDKEVTAFFDSLGVNQANMLLDLNSGVQKSNETMSAFLRQLGQTSDQEFQKMISGMDILAANTLTMMRNNADEITRLIRVSAGESEGMLSNTDAIIASYSVTWERTWNNLVSIVISALQSISGQWLPEFLSNAVSMLGLFSAAVRDTFQGSLAISLLNLGTGSAFKETKASYVAFEKSLIVQELQKAKAAGDYKKIAQLTLDLERTTGTVVNKQVDAKLLSIQLAREENLEKLKTKQITKEQFETKLAELNDMHKSRLGDIKADGTAYKNAGAQLEKIATTKKDIAGHQAEINRLQAKGNKITSDERDQLKVHQQAVSKLKSEYAGVAAQVEAMSKNQNEGLSEFSRNVKDTDSVVREFNTRASAGIASKGDLDFTKKSLKDAYNDAINLTKILDNPDLAGNTKKQINSILKSNISTLEMRQKIQDIPIVNPREQNVIDQINGKLDRAFKIKNDMVTVEKNYSTQFKKNASAHKQQVSELDKEINLKIEKQRLEAESALYQEAAERGELSRIDQLTITRDMAQKELNLIKASKGLKDKDLETKKAQLALDKAEYELSQAKNSELEKQSKLKADILMHESKIQRLYEQANFIHKSEVALAESALETAKKTFEEVAASTNDEQKKLSAAEDVLKAQIDLNTAKQKQHELDTRLTRELKEQKDAHHYTKRSLENTLLITQQLTGISAMPNNSLDYTIKSLGAVYNISKRLAGEYDIITIDQAITQFKNTYNNLTDDFSKAQTQLGNTIGNIADTARYYGAEKQRAVALAQEEVNLVRELMHITDKDIEDRTEEEKQKLINNGIRTETDLREANIKLTSAQTAKLQEQVGIVNEYNAIMLKYNPLSGKLKYADEFAKIKEQMKGVDTWTNDMSQKVALERSKTDWDRYVDGLEDSTSQMKQIVQNAFGKMEDAIVQFTTTGKFSFKDFVNSILEDLLRMTIRMQITAPLAKAVGGIDFASMFSLGSSTTTTSTAPATDLGFRFAAKGGPLPTKKFAYGGKLYGGTGFKDDIYLGSASGSHVFAMGGEYILNRAATQSIGSSTLDYMNKTGQAPMAAQSTSVVVNIENKSGQEMTAEKMSEYTRQNDRGEQEKVINFVIDGVNRNMNGARDILKGLR